MLQPSESSEYPEGMKEECMKEVKWMYASVIGLQWQIACIFFRNDLYQ